VFGLESIKEAEENVIQEAPLPVWANFQQRALDVTIAEVNNYQRTEIRQHISAAIAQLLQNIALSSFGREGGSIPSGSGCSWHGRSPLPGLRRRSRLQAKQDSVPGTSSTIATISLIRVWPSRWKGRAVGWEVSVKW
jgi:hypothetical protein